MLVKFVFFGLVGVVGTLAHYSVLFVLVELQGLNPVAASSWGALVGLVVNYILNFKLTFSSSQSHKDTFPKFALIALFGMGFNIALMALLVQHIYYIYAQIITTLIVFGWNFIVNFVWTFAKDHQSNMSMKAIIPNIKSIPFSLGLVLSILTMRIATLGLYPLYDPSESRYAEMARKMLESNEWVMPMFDYGVPFWGKPPLAIWLTALSMGVGGLNDFSARLPSVLLGIVMVWIIFKLMKVQRGVDHAFSATVILSSSVLFFVMAGSVATDPAMCLGITLALSSFWLALKEQKPYWGYLFFIGLSIGLMAKGPITLVLSGVTIGLWAIFSGRWLDIWRRVPWITGTLLMLCICVPWFLIAEQKTPGFLKYFFIGEHWQRFTQRGWSGDLYGVGHAHPKGMIWVYWLAAGFPWTLVFFKMLLTATVRKESKQLIVSGDGWRLYCLLWMASPLLFFTLSANIIWTYVLPGLPGMALLLADWLGQSKKYRTVLALCVPVSFSAIVGLYQFPEIDFYKSQGRLVENYLQHASPDEHLIYLDDSPPSAEFYLQGKSYEVSGIEGLQKSLNSPSHNFYALKKEIVDTLPQALTARIKPIASYGKFILFQAAGN